MENALDKLESPGLETQKQAAPLSTTMSKVLADAAVLAASEKSLLGGRASAANVRHSQFFNRLIRQIIILGIAIPTVLSSLYFFVIAADQYSVNSAVVVKASSGGLGDILSSLGSGGGAASSGASILVEYLDSEDVVRELEPEIRAALSSPKADWFVRLSTDASFEKLVRKWRSTTNFDYEPQNKIVKIEMKAFSPDDALNLSQSLLAAGGDFIQNLSVERKQADLRLYEDSLKRAEQRLFASIRSLNEFRSERSLLDGEKQAGLQGELVSDLELTLAQLKITKVSLGNFLDDNSQRLTNLDIQIKSLEDEIERQRKRVFDGNSASQGTANPGTGRDVVIGTTLEQFDRLEVNRDVTQKAYVAAAAEYEAARIASVSNDMFLSVFLKPTKPETPSHPKRFWLWLLSVGIIVACALGLAKLVALLKESNA